MAKQKRRKPVKFPADQMSLEDRYIAWQRTWDQGYRLGVPIVVEYILDHAHPTQLQVLLTTLIALHNELAEAEKKKAQNLCVYRAKSVRGASEPTWQQ